MFVFDILSKAIWKKNNAKKEAFPQFLSYPSLLLFSFREKLKLFFIAICIAIKNSNNSYISLNLHLKKNNITELDHFCSFDFILENNKLFLFQKMEESKRLTWNEIENKILKNQSELLTKELIGNFPYENTGNELRIPPWYNIFQLNNLIPLIAFFLVFRFISAKVKKHLWKDAVGFR